MSLIRLGYEQGKSEHTLFIKSTKDGRKSILIVYVDDIIVTWDDKQGIEVLKKQLRAEFEVKDLGHM